IQALNSSLLPQRYPFGDGLLARSSDGKVCKKPPSTSCLYPGVSLPDRPGLSPLFILVPAAHSHRTRTIWYELELRGDFAVNSSTHRHHLTAPEAAAARVNHKRVTRANGEGDKVGSWIPQVL